MEPLTYPDLAQRFKEFDITESVQKTGSIASLGGFSEIFKGVYSEPLRAGDKDVRLNEVAIKSIRLGRSDDVIYMRVCPGYHFNSL